MFGIDVRAARMTWTAALVVVALYCVYTVRTTLLVMLFGVFFSYLVYPVFTFAQRLLGRRLPRVALLLLVFALVIGTLALLVLLFGNRIADEASALGQELPKLFEPGALAKRLPLPALLEPWRERLVAMLQKLFAGGPAQALPVVRGVGAELVRVAGNLVYVVVVPIFSFLMILEAPVLEALLAALREKEQGALWCSVANGLNRLLSRYVRALAILSLATLAAYSAVLSLLGAPFALLLATLAALFEVIPVFGPLVAGAAILAVAGFSGYAHVWWLLAFIAAYRVFQDYMLNPWLMSEGVNVPPILVVFGLLAGEELAGVAGIFLSVPFLAAVRIVVVEVRAYRAKAIEAQPEPLAR